MSSFLKQNKVVISKIKNSLETELKKKNRNRGDSRGFYIGRSYLHVPSSVLDNYGYGMSIPTTIYAKSFDIVVREYDSRIVFGLEIKKMKCYPVMRDVISNLYYYVDGSIPSDSALRNQIRVEMKGHALSYSTIDMLEDTTIYREICNYLENEAEDTFVFLKDGEYPYVKDREILPLYTAVKDDGSGWYIHYSNNSGLTYRQNHSKTDMIEFNRSDASIVASAIPAPLLKLKSRIAGSEYTVRV